MGKRNTTGGMDGRSEPGGNANDLIPYGTTTLDGNRAYAFFKWKDENLWCMWESANALINWSNLGTPPGVSLKMSMGTVALDDSRYYVFVLCDDNNLWCCFWTGSEYLWSNLQQPPIKQVASADDATPGSGSIAAPMGAMTIDKSRYYVFVRGKDNNLWVCWWNGSQYLWENQGSPIDSSNSKRISVKQSMGSMEHQGAYYVFALCDDNNVWANWWDGSQAQWTNYGSPPDTLIQHSLGATRLMNVGPVLVAVDIDNKIWVFNQNAGASWHKQHHLSFGTIDTDAGYATHSGSNTVGLLAGFSQFYFVNTKGQTNLLTVGFSKTAPASRSITALLFQLPDYPMTNIVGIARRVLQPGIWLFAIAEPDGNLYAAGASDDAYPNSWGWGGYGSPNDSA